MPGKSGKAYMPGAVSGWGLEVVRVRDALGQCDIAVLPGQREVMPHLDESQYVPRRCREPFVSQVPSGAKFWLRSSTSSGASWRVRSLCAYT